MSLTPEQRHRIEENRKLAIQKRLQKQSGLQQVTIPENKSTLSNNRPSSNLPASPNNFYGSNTKPPNSPAPVNSSSAQIKVTYGGIGKSTPPKLSAPDPQKNVTNWQNKTSARDANSKPTTWLVTTETISGTCSLISKDRFTADIPYNQKVIDLFKTIEGRQYEATTRRWSFPLSQYEKFKEIMGPLAPQIIFGNLPKAVTQIFLQPSSKNNIPALVTDEDPLEKIDKTLVDYLFPFQKEGVRFGISKNGRCLIADEMGLGKTIQALGIMDYYKSDWPLMIVCPSSMRYQWEEEIHRFLPYIPTYSIFVITSKKDFIENAKVVIISFDLMGRLKDFLKSHGFGCIIIDESHNLKSIKTQRTKAALEIISKSKRCVLLSGTPALSRPSELFPQVKALQPKLFKDMIEFGVRYCEGKQDRFGWNFSGSCHLEELRVILDEKIMIRRLKANVLDQLPTKMRQVIVLSGDGLNVNSKSMNAFAKKLSRDSMKGAEKRSTLLSYFAETARAKMKAVCEYLEKLLEQNKKFLVFAHHREMMDAVCNLLEQKSTYYIRIDGTVSSEERKSVCDQFQGEDKFRVAVLSIKAANTGVTLTAAQLIVFAELFWNPGELIQAEDRAHRIGQKYSVLVHYLLAKGTADDYLWPLVQSKLNVLQQAGLSKDSHLEVESTKQGNAQPKITNFFSEMYDDDIDETDLASLLDEIEGVPEKKLKLDNN